MEIKIKQLKPLLWACFAPAFYLLSCQKTSNTISDYDRPVVESYLVPGKAIQVKVYYQKYLDDTIQYGYPIPKLKLKISDGTNTVQLVESNPGIYVYTDSSFIKEKKSYSLSFDYANKTITAKTTVPDKPAGFSASSTQQEVVGFTPGSTTTTVFQPVTFSWNNPSQQYYMIVYKNVTLNPDPVNSGDTVAYKDREVIVGQVSSFETQRLNFAYLGNYKVLLFHINKEYSDALNSSGTTSLNLTNPVTNVVNGLGIFTAMQADTLQLLVYQ
jgi:hypothetical protein